MDGEKMADVICIGAAVVDIPLRPVSKNIFDIEWIYRISKSNY